MSGTIRQSVTFNATPHDVYEALMDSTKHAEFTGDEAAISRVVGGPVMAYGGYITGKNLELAPDEKIVQTWRASDWPAGAGVHRHVHLDPGGRWHAPDVRSRGRAGRTAQGHRAGLDRLLLDADEAHAGGVTDRAWP